ncbi:MAG: zf-HC2 domain-containing protein [Candidatus Omnitrophica bacterium]|nr:zf-HC2 domain-containing protein [Candidatus Omnitrophota bacterium]
MTCAEVDKALKSFLEDLLVEDEYQAVVAHLEGCSRCREYVGSIGSLSNQLWELGNVKVPADLADTVLFKLKEAEARGPEQRFVISRRALIALAAAAAGMAALYVVFHVFKTGRRPPPDIDAPIVTMERIREDAGQGAREPGPGIAEQEEGRGAAQPGEAGPAAGEPAAVPAAESEKSSIVLHPLHWHFEYADETAKSKLLEILAPLGSRTDYLDGELLSFASSKEAMEQVVERMVLASGEGFLRQDFTAGTPLFQNTANRLLVYLGKTGAVDSDALHWHVGFVSADQKQLFVTVIKKTGGSVEHEEEGFMVISVSRTDVGTLRERVQATGAVLTEFGRLNSSSGVLSSNPVKISIYFLN